MSKRRNSGLWTHLDQLGILATGSPAEIEHAKKEYWKAYFLAYRRTRRTAHPEFIIALAKDNGDYQTIAHAAKKHRMTITAFIRAAALNYTRQTFIIPDRSYLAHLQQLLSLCANEVQAIAGTHERYFWQREEKINAIEKRIEQLEHDIRILLEQPPELTAYIRTATPGVKAHILSLLT